MTPHLQLIDHDPEAGRWGDCGRTAIACLLDLAPEEVPHFYDKGAGGACVDRIKTPWFQERKLSEINIIFPGETPLNDVLHSVGVLNPGAHFMLMGKSATGCNHVVICRDGVIIHDPSPKKPGIIGPCIEDGYWWVTFIGVKA